MRSRTTTSKSALPAVVPADVSAALDELGIDHNVRGNEALGLCPSPDHDDSKPSWSCNLENGMHHCFSCGWGGSFIKLVAQVNGTRYESANLWVRTHRIAHPLDGEEISKVADRRAREVRESDLWECVEPPFDLLAERCISPDAARSMEIVWHPSKNCWIFPIRDPDTGKLIGWQEKSDRRFVNRPVDLDRRRSLFGLAHLRATGADGYVAVVESPLDAGRFMTAGVDRVVSTYGIEFTDEQIAILFTLADEIIFAQDNDLAGQRKVARWLKTHPADAMHARVFDYGGVYEDRYTRQHVHPAGDGRDPGNLTDRDLLLGIRDATPAWRTRFEAVA